MEETPFRTDQKRVPQLGSIVAIEDADAPVYFPPAQSVFDKGFNPLKAEN